MIAETDTDKDKTHTHTPQFLFENFYFKKNIFYGWVVVAHTLKAEADL